MVRTMIGLARLILLSGGNCRIAYIKGPGVSISRLTELIRVMIIDSSLQEGDR